MQDVGHGDDGGSFEARGDGGLRQGLVEDGCEHTCLLVSTTGQQTAGDTVWTRCSPGVHSNQLLGRRALQC